MAGPAAAPDFCSLAEPCPPPATLVDFEKDVTFVLEFSRTRSQIIILRRVIRRSTEGAPVASCWCRAVAASKAATNASTHG
jgi:hypothetical protein